MPVRIEHDGPILTVTIDRQPKRNAIDSDTSLAIDAALNDFEDDPALRVAILTGAGPIFSAGTDLQIGPGDPTPRGGEYGLIRRRALKPIIAAVDGPALGGGFEIAMACDFVVASRAAVFSLPEARRGVIASSGALFRAFDRLPRNVALELLIAGRPLDAERAYALGFVNDLTDVGEALEGARRLAQEICESAPNSVEQTLAAVRTLAEDSDAAGWQATSASLAHVIDSDDMREGVSAFFEHRPPRWSKESL